MKFLKTKLAVAGLAMGALPAFAVGPNFTELSQAVDFTTATTAVLAVAVNILIVYIAFKGAKILIAAVKGI